MRVPAFIEDQLPRLGETAANPPCLGVFGRLIAAVRRELADQRATRQLAAMDDRMLADIGMCRSDIMHSVRIRNHA